MLFNNNDLDFSFFEIPGSDFKLEIDRNKFVSPSTGFQRGNMMRDEYIPYKNYNDVKLIAKNEQERLRLKIMELAFAITDFNLYLDLHPDDTESYKIFKQYVDEGKKLEQEYTTKFGPLAITNVQSQKYEWLKNPWPWDESGGNLYV